MRYPYFRQTVTGYFCCCFLVPCVVKAETSFIDWEAQLYGGDYYEDKRIAAYGVASRTLLDRFTIIGELLRERYREGASDYDFSGIGGHLLWEAAQFARFGVVGSHSHEEYTYEPDFDDPNAEYAVNILGLEGELNHDLLTLAVQIGEISSDYYSNDHTYVAADMYFWGAENRWYGRGAVRTTKNYEEYTVEAYRALLAKGLPITFYVGANRNDLTTEEEIRSYHTQYDSLYTGCYIEFATTTLSSWNLWVEAAKQETDMVLSVELNVTFGPGADTPYLSAFGFTP